LAAYQSPTARGRRDEGSSFWVTAKLPVSTIVAAQACTLPRWTTRSWTDQPGQEGTGAVRSAAATPAANRSAAVANSARWSRPVAVPGEVTGPS